MPGLYIFVKKKYINYLPFIYDTPRAMKTRARPKSAPSKPKFKPKARRGRAAAKAAVPAPRPSAGKKKISASPSAFRSPPPLSTSPVHKPVTMTVDDLGIYGSAVRVPSPAVWRVVVGVASTGTVEALRTALAGASVPATANDFWLECWLAMATEKADPELGSHVRVMHAGKWRDASVIARARGIVRGIVIAKLEGGGGTCRLDTLDWWYLPPKVSPLAAPTKAPAPAREPRLLTHPVLQTAVGWSNAHAKEKERDGYSALCCSRPDGRLLNPKVAAWMRHMEDIHGRSAALIFADVHAAFPAVTIRDVHTALALSGGRAAVSGQCVMVPFTKVRRRICPPFRHLGTPPDP